MNRAGMTLIEVIVVLLILSVAAGMVAPAIGDLSLENPLEQSTREVLLMLRDARRVSQENGVEISVTIDPSSNRYWVYSPEDATPHADALGLADGVSIVGGAELLHVGFGTLGTSRSDPVSLVAGSDRRTVVVNRWSGDISVE